MTSLRDLFKKSKKTAKETTDKILDADIDKIKDKIKNDAYKSLKDFEEKKVPIYRSVLIKILIIVSVICTIIFIVMMYNFFNGN